MKNYLNPLSSLAIVGTLVLSLAACDGDDPDPPDPPVTNPDFDAVYDTTGTEITVEDQGLGLAPGVDDVTWESGNTYILANRVFVNDGQTLTIEPGTVIKGEPGLAENATALIVSRGGTIDASGTASDPIIFTAQADDVNNPNDEPGPGSWGGVIILGTATTNIDVGVANIEGIPTEEERARYGCGDEFSCNDNDNSGTFRYVSIRYGGTNIGEGNEINGLTLGAVGAGTTIDHVEVLGNDDDGVEFFGGTVNTKYMVMALNVDDSFDTDQGYRGKGQYWLSVQANDAGNRGAEMDGGQSDTGGEDAEPWSTPEIWNATYIGSGVSNENADFALKIRDNSGASYFRSVFLGFNQGVDVEDVDGTEGDSRARLEDGTIALEQIVFGSMPGGYWADGQTWVEDYFNGRSDLFFEGDESMVVSTDRSALNPTSAGSAADAANLGDAPSDGFFDNASCMGAVCPGDNWLSGWTALDQLGYLNM